MSRARAGPGALSSASCFPTSPHLRASLKLLAPLGAQLREAETAVADQARRVAQLKAQIARNEQTIAGLVAQKCAAAPGGDLNY